MDTCNKTESNLFDYKSDDSDCWSTSGLSGQNQDEIVSIYDADTHSFIITIEKYRHLNISANLNDFIAFALKDSCIVKLKLVKQYGYVIGANVIELIAESIKGNECLFTSLEVGLSQSCGIKAELEAQILPNKVSKKEIAKEVSSGRVDLRSIPFFTIDGAETKDFDDAIYVEELPSGYLKVWVAIADVSYYVKPYSQMDIEAFFRGASVYHPTMVIPMLPFKLSNNLCSLMPHQDRMALTTQVIINPKNGEIVKYKFIDSIINSKARLTYEQVGDALNDKFDDVLTEDFLESYIKPLQHFTNIRLLNKEKRGGITLEELLEKKPNHNDSLPRKMIEESMIVANIASTLALDGKPCLYRVHEAPSIGKLKGAVKKLEDLGFDFGEVNWDKFYIDDFHRVLKVVKENKGLIDCFDVVVSIMKKAYYSSNNQGHFGLSLASYTHFTSPIRRYPDVLIHRALKYHVLKQREGAYCYKNDEVENMGVKLSSRDQRAGRLVKTSERRMIASEYEKKIGQSVKVRVTAVYDDCVHVRFGDIKINFTLHADDLKQKGYVFDYEQGVWASSKVRYCSLEKKEIKEQFLISKTNRCDSKKITVEILDCDIIAGDIEIELVRGALSTHRNRDKLVAVA